MPELLVRTPDPFAAACPSRRLVDLVGSKWALLLLPALKGGPCRNGALMRRLDGVSQKMLTQTLRALERSGLVVRSVFDTVPPHVEYRLTPLGQSLAEALASFDVWVRAHSGEVEVARQQFDAEQN